MKKIVAKFLIGVSLLSISNADFIGGEVGFAGWSTKLSGDIKKGADSLDFEKDLGFGDSKANSFAWAYIDHPVPLLPNLKIQKTNWSDSGEGLITAKIFDNKTINGRVKTDLTLDQLDIIPYWRLLDNWINFDLGLNFKLIDGNIKIDSDSQDVDTDFKAVVPMGYAKVRFDMPFTGLSIEADVSYISYSGSSFSDIKGGLVYQLSLAPLLAIGATVGYRQENLTLDDVDGIYGKIDIKGPYFGAFVHF